MLPSLRGTVSGSGPAPPEEEIVNLMAENREAWDPAAGRGTAPFVAREPSAESIRKTEEETGERIVRQYRVLARPESPVHEVAEQVASELGLFAAVPAEAPDASEYVQELGRIAGTSQNPRTIKRAANLMAAMARGDVPAASLVVAPPHFFRWVPVGSVLSGQPGWSEWMARRHLKGLSIDSEHALELLSEDQRRALANSLDTLDSTFS
jgi:hypothetical protein